MAAAHPLSLQDKRSIEAILGVDLIAESAEEEEVRLAIDTAWLTLSISNPEGLGSNPLTPFTEPTLEHSAIPRTVQALITRAMAFGASDIHIDPDPRGSLIVFESTAFSAPKAPSA